MRRASCEKEAERHEHCAGFATATGINIKKGGTDPELRPFAELPEWAQNMAVPGPSLYGLNKRLKAEGEEAFAAEPEVSISCKCEAIFWRAGWPEFSLIHFFYQGWQALLEILGSILYKSCL